MDIMTTSIIERLYSIIDIKIAVFWEIIFFVNNVFLLFFISSFISFEWFQKFDAPLDNRVVIIPIINSKILKESISVNFVEIKKRKKAKIGMGEIIENGENINFAKSIILLCMYIMLKTS